MKRSLNLEVMETIRRLSKNYLHAFKPDLAQTQNNLAFLYSNTKRFSESEALYLDALETRRRLAKGNSKAHKSTPTQTPNNLGQLKTNQKFYDEVISCFNDALVGIIKGAVRY